MVYSCCAVLLLNCDVLDSCCAALHNALYVQHHVGILVFWSLVVLKLNYAILLICGTVLL